VILHLQILFQIQGVIKEGRKRKLTQKRVNRPVCSSMNKVYNQYEFQAIGSGDIFMTVVEIEQILVREISIILGGSEVGEDVPLHELGLDSMSFVELLVFIEKKFNLKLVDSGLGRENFKTVRALANRIYEKLR